MFSHPANNRRMARPEPLHNYYSLTRGRKEDSLNGKAKGTRTRDSCRWVPTQRKERKLAGTNQQNKTPAKKAKRLAAVIQRLGKNPTFIQE